MSKPQGEPYLGWRPGPPAAGPPQAHAGQQRNPCHMQRVGVDTQEEKHQHHMVENPRMESQCTWKVSFLNSQEPKPAPRGRMASSSSCLPAAAAGPPSVPAGADSCVIHTLGDTDLRMCMYVCVCVLTNQHVLFIWYPKLWRQWGCDL